MGSFLEALIAGKTPNNTPTAIDIELAIRIGCQSSTGCISVNSLNPIFKRTDNATPMRVPQTDKIILSIKNCDRI